MAGMKVARWKAEIFGSGLLAGIGGFFLSLPGDYRPRMRPEFPVQALFRPLSDSLS